MTFCNFLQIVLDKGVNGCINEKVSHSLYKQMCGFYGVGIKPK